MTLNSQLSTKDSPMAPNSTHPDYDAFQTAWSQARDVLAGEAAIKAAGTRYLRALDNQPEDEYEAYKARALFFNATARTADGFLGLIFRRAPFFKLPDAKSVLGTTFTDF